MQEAIKFVERIATRAKRRDGGPTRPFLISRRDGFELSPLSKNSSEAVPNVEPLLAGAVGPVNVIVFAYTDPLSATSVSAATNKFRHMMNSLDKKPSPNEEKVTE
jgi:hypothetical protein